MSESENESTELAHKITRLVEERGWNQEDFARIAGLNRHTVRTLVRGERKLRNATVQASAHALGLTVSELRALPLERLLPRMHKPTDSPGDDRLRHLLANATLPALISWIQRNEDRARSLSLAEADELLGLQTEKGPLATLGVERVVELFERRREVVNKVHAIAASEYLELLEQIVDLMFEKVKD